MGSDRTRAIAMMKQRKAERAEMLRRGLEAAEQIVAQGWGFLVTSERIRTEGGPDVLLDRVRSWHVRWSHDERPRVVVAHDPIIVSVRTRARTILWFHLGNRPREEARTITILRFSGRRRPEFRATVARLEAARLPRGPDEHEALRGTRDERLGAQVSPYLLVKTRGPRPDRFFRAGPMRRFRNRLVISRRSGWGPDRSGRDG